VNGGVFIVTAGRGLAVAVGIAVCVEVGDGVTVAVFPPSTVAGEGVALSATVVGVLCRSPDGGLGGEVSVSVKEGGFGPGPPAVGGRGEDEGVSVFPLSIVAGDGVALAATVVGVPGGEVCVADGLIVFVGMIVGVFDAAGTVPISTAIVTLGIEGEGVGLSNNPAISRLTTASSAASPPKFFRSIGQLTCGIEGRGPKASSAALPRFA
jgi:hypothetical protein